MSALLGLARVQSDDLRAADAAVATRLATQYAGIRTAIERDLERVNDRIARAAIAGQPISPAVLYQQGRASAFLAEVTERLERYQAIADKAASDAVRRAAVAGLEDGQALVDAALPEGIRPSFSRLRPDVIDASIASAHTVAQLLPRVNAPARLEAILNAAVARGVNPRESARELAAAVDMPLSRALTITRTETLRAYRNATTLAYQGEAETLRGWQWLSAADDRTCAACFAMHGQIFRLDQPMTGHPNCRCTQVPLTRPYSELVDGFDDDAMPGPAVADGSRLFSQLGPAQQRRALGRAGYDAYRRGDVRLEDFVRWRDHPIYGRTPGKGSLSWAREQASRRRAEGAIRPPARPIRPRRTPVRDTTPTAGASVSTTPRFTSKADAADWLKRQGIVSGDVDFGRIPMKGVQQITDALADSLGRHGVTLRELRVGGPGAPGRMAYFARHPSDPSIPGRISVSPRAANPTSAARIAAQQREAAAAQRARAIERARDYANDADLSESAREAARKILADLEGMSRFTTYDDASQVTRSIVLHEAAHAVDHKIGLTFYGNTRWADALSRAGVTRADRLAVSEYAASTDTELFAEAFTMAADGRALPARIAAALREVLS